jgi:hypothetical protein
MPTITQVGNELAEVPFGDMLRSIAEGIADGQHALDLTSLRTLQELTQLKVAIIPEITEVITPQPFDVPISGQAPVRVTGARVEAIAAAPVEMTALQAGIEPTFYQFTEATIQLKVSIQLRETRETSADGKSSRGLRAFTSNVNFRTKNTYSYNVEASSSVTAIMRPVPAPSRLTPTTITVNALGPTPIVNIGP